MARLSKLSRSIKDKVALVTGAASGMGRATAQLFADEGAHVAVTDLDQGKVDAVVQEITAAGGSAAGYVLDVASDVDRQRVVAAIVERWGGLDILVNNAGIARGVGPVEGWTLEDIDQLLAVNVRGVILASQAAAVHLPRGGRIINIGSNLAERVPMAGITLYAMTKSALLSFTKGLAHDLGPRGVTVNLVHPGSTNTDMNPADGDGADHQRARMPIQEYGKPEEIAGMVAWLASPEGRFANGAGFTVDGGANA